VSAVAPGLARLRERIAAIPERVAAFDDAAVRLPALGGVPRAGVVATGAGSSREHARLLAALLAELGVPARVAAPSAFLGAPAPADAPDALLVVFSQGLSPNARAALAAAPRYRAAALVSAAGPGDADPARVAALAAFESAGGVRFPLPVGRESGLLVRVVGPMLGHLAAIALARALGAAWGRAAPWPALPAAAVAAALRDAAARARGLREAWPADPLGGALAFLAGGAHAERASHLSRKLLEGLLVPWPPIWDVVDFAHGGFQQLYAERATLLALARSDAPEEGPLFARAAAMRDPARHGWVTLQASLPGPYALLEHEAALNELLLAALEARRVDPARWPGQGRDTPLYALAAPPERTAAPDATMPAPEAASAPPSAATPEGPRAGAVAPSGTPARALAALAWPEVEALLAAGARTAVVPLGSTEQHGAHLPFATDTRIAEALAARFCARVPEAVALPALPFGCAPEHLGFPGTLSLAPETLRALLADVVASLGGAGFERVFVFSAHGGNAGPLAEAAERLAAAAPRADVVVFADHAAAAEAVFAEAARAGVAREAAGHHAGEIETSILLALAPEDVRRARAAPGLLDVPRDAQAIFYPDLRANAPGGVVGDPRPADPARAARYLDAWVDVLVACYERAKKRANANGTKSA